MGLEATLCIIVGTKGCQLLNKFSAIFIFVISGGLSIWAFFFVSDLSFWGDVNNFVAVGITSLAWVLIFPIWILIFLSFMFLLQAIGITRSSAIEGKQEK